VKDWRSRLAVGAVLAVTAGVIVMILYGLYAGRLLTWRRAVSARQAVARHAEHRRQAVADSLDAEELLGSGAAPWPARDTAR
jgi:hypothetical protein